MIQSIVAARLQRELNEKYTIMLFNENTHGVPDRTIAIQFDGTTCEGLICSLDEGIRKVIHTLSRDIFNSSHNESLCIKVTQLTKETRRPTKRISYILEVYSGGSLYGGETVRHALSGTLNARQGHETIILE